MVDKPIFVEHPAPWRIEKNAATCGNGGRIDFIVDANGDTVMSNYGSSFGYHALWAFYLTLTREQEEALGRPPEPVKIE